MRETGEERPWRGGGAGHRSAEPAARAVWWPSVRSDGWASTKMVGRRWGTRGGETSQVRATAQVALGLLAVDVGSKTGHGVRRRSRRRQDDSGGWTQRLVAARAERDGAAL
jgi:hypothetical protein